MRSWRNHKYNAKKTYVGNIKFDSKAEAEYYLYLKSMTHIDILELQPKVYLTKSRILYKPDFKTFNKNTGETIHVDVKGLETPVFKLKKRLWKHYGQGVLQIVKKQRNSWEVTEVVKKHD